MTPRLSAAVVRVRPPPRSALVRGTNLRQELVSFREQLHRRARELQRTVVLAEGWDARVQHAARRLGEAGTAETIVLTHDHLPRVEEVAALLRTRRPDKVANDAQAIALASNPIVLAVGHVALGEADAAVAGATCPTADVVRAALWLVGPAEGITTVSSAFYMILPDTAGVEGRRTTARPPGGGADGQAGRRATHATVGLRGEAEGDRQGGESGGVGARPGIGEGEVLTFTDAAVVPDPTPDQLAEIAAAAAADRRRIVGDEPIVAFLSYSTKGSADGPRVVKVREAVERFRELAPDTPCDGELQGDAALVPEVADRKAPGSQVEGMANVLVFPDLDSGNIAYKLVQRLAGAAAVGPIIQGLAKPVADLSRGASAEDIVDVAAVAILQSDRRSTPAEEMP